MFLSMSYAWWRNILPNGANIPTEIITTHIELLRGSEVDLLSLLVVWLLRGLSRLMMVMVVRVLSRLWRHVACGWWPGGDTICAALAMERGAIVGLLGWHALFLVDWGLRAGTTQSDLLGMVQKVREGRFLSSFLINCLWHLSTSMSRWCRMTSFFTVAVFARVHRLMSILRGRSLTRRSLLLALSHRSRSFGNWSRILSVATILGRSIDNWRVVLLWVLHGRIRILKGCPAIPLRAVTLCCMRSRIWVSRRVMLLVS
jgi:hypothetical protein